MTKCLYSINDIIDIMMKYKITEKKDADGNTEYEFTQWVDNCGSFDIILLEITTEKPKVINQRLYLKLETQTLSFSLYYGDIVIGL